MKTRFAVVSLTVLSLAGGFAQLPDNLVFEGIPATPPEVKNTVARYLEFRAAGFNDWHPTKREMLITTRFADATQLHLVKTPGGARRQLTFLPEPVAYGTFDPKDGAFIVFNQDMGGAEFFQFYRYDLADGRVTLLTDGKSRNLDLSWSKDGTLMAYTSTRRNGRDTDIYVMNPRDPKSDQMLAQVEGGGWRIHDWSWDGAKLLLGEYISINESRLYLCDAKSGKMELLTPKSAEKVSWAAGGFAKGDKSLFVRTDQDSEFLRLGRFVEYGDERDPVMAEFLGKISPANHADKITKPLFVVQGLNDPRVPATESQQMVKAIRDHGGTVWFLMAKDEGHGFQKKRNADVMFESTVLFLKENLLK